MHGSTSCSMARRQTMLRCFSFFIISSSLVLIWMWTVRTRSANTLTAHTSPKRYQHTSNNTSNRQWPSHSVKGLRPMSHLRFYCAILSHECATLLSDKVADTVTFKPHAATFVALTKRLLHHFSRFTILLHKYSSKMVKLFHISSFWNSSIDHVLSFCQTAYSNWNTCNNIIISHVGLVCLRDKVTVCN